MSVLHERGSELASLGHAIDDLSRGEGRCIVIEGPAGIGKTRLLGAARERARDAGVRVLRARGSELERTAPFGLVHQLLDVTVRRATEEQRAGWFKGAASLAGPVFDVGGAAPAPADLYPTLHGLYWLLAELAAGAPTVLLCDDVQWADDPSLAFLEFLARRIEDLPVLLVLGTRPAAQSGRGMLASLTADPDVAVLRPGTLSADAIDVWTRAVLPGDPETAFLSTCLQVTGGNPLLVSELLRDLAARGLPPTRRAAVDLVELAPDGVASVALLRLAALPAEARGLAAAVSVLGDDTTPAQASALAALDSAAAADAATALVRAGVLSDGTDALAFTHPLLRASVYASLSAVDRATAHGRAAALLRQAGARPASLAAHLLKTSPAGDPEVVAALQAAAEGALEVGDAAGAAVHLRRALEEPPAGAARTAVLVGLGTAEWLAGEPAWLLRHREAIAAAADEHDRASLVLDLARKAKWTDSPAAVEMLAEQLDRAGVPAALTALLEAELVSSSSVSLPAYELAQRRLHAPAVPDGAPASFAEAVVLCGAAFAAATGGTGTAAEAVDMAARAMASGHLTTDPATGAHAFTAAAAMVFAGARDQAVAILDGAVEAARAGGSPVGVSQALSVRAWALSVIGRVRESETDATEALGLAAEGGVETGMLVLASAALALAAVERGAPRAELLDLERHLIAPARDTDALPYDVLLFALGRVRAALGDNALALETFRSVGARGARWGCTVAFVGYWQTEAARVLLRTGHRDDALALARRQLDAARSFGERGALGAAIREEALARGEEDLLDRLTEAVDVLATTPDLRERALAQLELGAALRRTGAKGDAREPLAAALELATELGATVIAERARGELLASGARPRRSALRGVDALTPSERRVAGLAAGGLTNRAIAQQLFVTDKTVEGHLASAYGKLGVRSRRDLPEALAA